MNAGPLPVIDLIRSARARQASDVHVAGGQRAALRVHGRLVIADLPPLDESALRAFIADTLSPAQLSRLEVRGTAGGAAPRGYQGAPFRIHAYRHAQGLRLAIRLLAHSVPALASLGLPPAVTELAARRRGLILFTGPTGSGKTTALAALVDAINRGSERVIVTVEDPVEYEHPPVRSLVTHCEVGRDVCDYAEALHGVLRADPDVVLVGELRDRDTIAAALATAETGHLVLTTLHTGDAAETVDRIVDAFPTQARPDVRVQLAVAVSAIVALRLVPRADGNGRVAAAEVMTGTDAVRALIREGKTHQLRNAIVTGRAGGMQTLETHLAELVAHGSVTLREARAASNRPAEVRGCPGVEAGA